MFVFKSSQLQYDRLHNLIFGVPFVFNFPLYPLHLTFVSLYLFKLCLAVSRYIHKKSVYAST